MGPDAFPPSELVLTAAHKTSQARDNNDNEKKNDVHDQGTKEAAVIATTS